MASTSTSVQVAVAHAVSFLTRPLAANYPATTIAKLQLVLEANLTAHYAPTWQSRDPLSGSAHRSLILSAECLPPRAIYASCVSAGVQWFDWMYFLGNSEFKLSVDPGRIYVQQCHSDSHPVTVWAAEVPSPAVATRKPRCDTIQAAIKRRYDAHQKTFAQEILENDNEEDDQLFSVLADHINAPQWMTPVTDKFPTSIHRSSSPLSSISSGSRSSYSAHSRSSSFSSNASSNGYSMESSSSSSTIASQSRRNKARQSRVYIDTTKNEVTPYDGGKTTVLTGGVMLGSKRA